MDRYPAEPKYKIPPERIRGYAQLGPEYAQYGLNIAAHFCHAVIERSIPHASLAPELQARMTREQVKGALDSAFETFGAWPSDYDFEDVLLVLCDDSVRVAGEGEDFGWPADLVPLRRRVILRFLWHFPAPSMQSLPCTFWVSASGQAMGVCKFAFHGPVQRPSSAKGVIATEAAMMARPRPPRHKSRGVAARKAVRKGKASWQLDGESFLDADTLPWPATSNAPTIIRLTHSNVDGPVDEADFFIRVGDLDHPSGPGDLDSASDWIQVSLVEELVYMNEQEMLRSEAEEPFEEGTPWLATYETALKLPSGRQRIEIKIVSRCPELLNSCLLSDWEVNVH